MKPLPHRTPNETIPADAPVPGQKGWLRYLDKVRRTNLKDYFDEVQTCRLCKKDYGTLKEFPEKIKGICPICYPSGARVKHLWKHRQDGSNKPGDALK